MDTGHIPGASGDGDAVSVAVPDTDTIEHLDFSPVLPCEHRQHRKHHHLDMPAQWRVVFMCKNPKCSVRGDYLLCEEGRVRMLPPRTVGCPTCGVVGYWDDFFIMCEPLEGK